jgi:hypothetical protein
MKKEIKELRALNKKYNISVKIDKNMPDYSKDPFFIAKNERAEKFIAEHGLPDSPKNKTKAKKLKAKA